MTSPSPTSCWLGYIHSSPDSWFEAGEFDADKGDTINRDQATILAFSRVAARWHGSVFVMMQEIADAREVTSQIRFRAVKRLTALLAIYQSSFKTSI